MTAVIIRSDFGALPPPNKVCHCFHYFSIYCHEVMGLDAMILASSMLSFKPAFSLSSVIFIKRLFIYSLLSAISLSLAFVKLDLGKEIPPLSGGKPVS